MNNIDDTITLNLTRSEANKLEVYLLMSTKFRIGEAEALEKLVTQFIETESVSKEVIDKTKDNAEFWREQCVVMNDIQERLLKALTTPNSK